MNKKIWIIVFVVFITLFLVFSGIFIVLYPLRYKENIIDSAQKYNLSKSLVSAIICVESRFNPKVKSVSGACGLMQIMPNTFEWICGELNYDKNQIFEPKINIDAGCFYIRYLYNKYNNLIYVLACYNAGEGTVSGWGTPETFDVSEIKYLETYNYVNKVLRLDKIYACRFS